MQPVPAGSSSGKVFEQRAVRLTARAHQGLSLARPGARRGSAPRETVIQSHGRSAAQGLRPAPKTPPCPPRLLRKPTAHGEERAAAKTKNVQPRKQRRRPNAGPERAAATLQKRFAACSRWLGGQCRLPPNAGHAGAVSKVRRLNRGSGRGVLAGRTCPQPVPAIQPRLTPPSLALDGTLPPWVRVPAHVQRRVAAAVQKSCRAKPRQARLPPRSQQLRTSSRSPQGNPPSGRAPSCPGLPGQGTARNVPRVRRKAENQNPERSTAIPIPGTEDQPPEPAQESEGKSQPESVASTARPARIKRRLPSHRPSSPPSPSRSLHKNNP